MYVGVVAIVLGEAGRRLFSAGTPNWAVKAALRAAVENVRTFILLPIPQG